MKLGGRNNEELFLFDEDSRIQGAQNQHQVIIQPLDFNNIGAEYQGLEKGEIPYVAGFLKGQFEYNVTADWQPMLDGISLPFTNIAGIVGKFTGKPIQSSGIFKRKFYQGTEGISFTIQFRMISDQAYAYDYTEKGEIKNPKSAAHFLASLCLPAPDPVIETITKGVDATTKYGGQILNAINGDTTGVEETAKKFGNALGGLSVNGVLNKGAEALEAAGVTLKSPFPRTARVKIGTYFESYDMIIKSVTATFSRENIYADDNGGRRYNHDAKTPKGNSKNLLAYQPLYVDFSVQVETRTVPVSTNGDANTGLIKVQPKVAIKDEIGGRNVGNG